MWALGKSLRLFTLFYCNTTHMLYSLVVTTTMPIRPSNKPRQSHYIGSRCKRIYLYDNLTKQYFPRAHTKERKDWKLV
jgi:hypothetical protein